MSTGNIRKTEGLFLRETETKKLETEMKIETTDYPEVVITHSNAYAELTKEQVPTVVEALTPASRKMLDGFVGEADDWNGQPCLGELTPQEKGNLGDLVKKGLVTVEHDKYDKVDWIIFPQAVMEHFGIEQY